MEFKRNRNEKELAGTLETDANAGPMTMPAQTDATQTDPNDLGRVRWTQKTRHTLPFCCFKTRTPLGYSVELLKRPRVILPTDPDNDIPKTLFDYDENKKLKCKKKLNEDVIARLFRLLSISILPILALFVMNELTNGGKGSSKHYLSRILGAAVAGLYTFYFVSLMVHLAPGCKNVKKEHYLFKVETRLKTVGKWASMRIANVQLAYPYQPIQSISEFSAISGGQANQMIANLGPMTWVGVAMMYAAQMQCDNGSDFNLDITDLFLVIGVNGIVTIGLFELNQFDKGMIAGHYLGVAMAIWLLVACMIQGISLGGANMVIPIVLNVIAWSTFVIWQWLSSIHVEKKVNELIHGVAENIEKENQLIGDQGEPDMKLIGDQAIGDTLKDDINRLSKWCVGLEGVAIYCTTLSLAVYLWQWGNTCETGCYKLP